MAESKYETEQKIPASVVEPMEIEDGKQYENRQSAKPATTTDALPSCLVR